MNTLAYFEPSRCERYSNSLHVAYHTNMLKELESQQTFKLAPNWSEIIAEYRQLYLRLVEANNQTTTYAETSGLSELNKERNRLLDRLFRPVKKALKSLDEQERLAAESIDALLRPFYEIKTSIYDNKTVDIQSMLIRMEKQLKKGELEAVGLTDIVQKIGRINRQFEELRNKRLVAYTKMKGNIPVAQVRKQIDALLIDILRIIYALGLLADAEEFPKINRLVGRLSSIISQYKTSYNRHAGMIRAKGEKEE